MAVSPPLPFRSQCVCAAAKVLWCCARACVSEWTCVFRIRFGKWHSDRSSVIHVLLLLIHPLLNFINNSLYYYCVPEVYIRLSIRLPSVDFVSATYIKRSLDHPRELSLVFTCFDWQSPYLYSSLEGEKFLLYYFYSSILLTCIARHTAYHTTSDRTNTVRNYERLNWTDLNWAELNSDWLALAVYLISHTYTNACTHARNFSSSQLTGWLAGRGV